MSWPWIVAVVWAALAVGMTFGWALHGSIVDEPVRPPDPEPMQWEWPNYSGTATSITVTTTGGNEQPPAAGVREPRRPRPQPPHLALVHEYVAPHTLQVVE